MQSIERYGVVALLLLIATVVAVLVWDGGAAEKPTTLAAEASPNRPAPMETSTPSGPAAETSGRGLVLRGRAQGRPLYRDPGSIAQDGWDPIAEPQQAEAPAAALQRPYLAAESDSPSSNPAPGRYAGWQNLEERTVAAPEPSPTQAPVLTRPAPASEPRRSAATPAAARPADARGSGGRPYVVQKGDTLSEVALAQLGTSKRWPEIVDMNPGLNPDRLIVGKTIRLPADAKGVSPVSTTASSRGGGSSSAPSGSGTTYRVRSGDSLWKIAERTLGNGERWRDIAALNPDVDPNRIAAGQRLTLPAGATAPTGAVSQPVVATNTGSTRRGRVR